MSNSFSPGRAVPLAAALTCFLAADVASADGEPWYNGCDVVPDAPAGYDFTEACNWHDLCIGGHIAGYSQNQCDATFHQYMNTVCDVNYGGDQACRFWSSTYYVGANQFGPCFYSGEFCNGVVSWFSYSWDYYIAWYNPYY